MNLTDRATLHLTNLRGSSDFQGFLEWLKEWERKEVDRCLECEGKELHQAQGAAKTLRKIAEAYEKAPHTLERMRNNR